MTNNQIYVKNPYYKGNTTGEIQGAYIQRGDEIHWNGYYLNADLIITGYTIIKKPETKIIDQYFTTEKILYR